MYNKQFLEQVSIVIVAKSSDYLLKTCISKIRELYKTVKIIIVLDEIDNEFEKNENITVLKSENLNMSAKRNLGVKSAETKYIAFIDSDAYPMGNWLEKSIEFLEKNLDYTAVTGCQYSPEEDSFEQKCLRLVRFNRLFTHPEWCNVINKDVEEYDCEIFMTSNVIIKKSDYEDIGGMNETIYLSEDNEFSQRLIKSRYKIRFIPKVSVFHRESKMYPFFRKIYCMSYYYANQFVKGKKIKETKQSIFQFFPLFGIFLFILLWISFLYLRINPYIILVLPFLVITLLIKEAVIEALKLPEKNIQGFFIIFFSFCLFCAVWVTGTFLGMINFPTKEIQSMYRHY